MEAFRRYWITLDGPGFMRTRLDACGGIWTRLDISGWPWIHADASGCVWRHPDAAGYHGWTLDVCDANLRILTVDARSWVMP
ncbi:Hydroxamate-type ferrichrome siderophore peptide synthetase [Frankliniella fusca]|uniref:Hydroxamate-type ferrichrome siderophore peptide synthetase n=1 Tax=Frankliniella fusca TaxID=407009 RepID=A0AAE1GWL8_9NEOP|nr:Hydroxamate-type ferrichrome siderophore peptide synthetase [Frankliniella fusca]